ncbi:Thiol:disulfide interchange protein DsbD [Roseibaca ekhonensis]|jgi:suppressor for copper-sensitivity B|uniref:Thiol:disulfide interchange protein DsbD n=2 Tax=Rhodobacterales TaxID=204455 RepID=A0A1Y5TYD6_9RHOB|nr:protein-disulfide reductase DsbD domain-containing protein [Roseibaca ekhonensis]SLN76465.1 Thiol:disulfide interchange protein DsbD precursor [Roseisalinus antarcticus]SUZ32589.1 Thiol:disulfide interchange protein DsbD [Roseibaca ekhonensis]
MLRTLIKKAIPALAMSALFFAIWVPAASAATSEQVTTPALSAQLITAENGVARGSGTISAGLALDLGEGWKTYWRTPGEVGFPPVIDWTGSRNVADVEFQWPAPERFTAFGIENFGYHDGVIFPLRIALEQPGQPARLSASVTLLTCSDVCVPQDFTLTLDLPRGASIDTESAARIADYAGRVPVEAEPGGVRSATAHVDADATALTVTLRRSSPFQTPDVFPELGEGTSLGAPDIRLGENGRLLWARLPILSAHDALTAVPSLTATDTGGWAATVTPEMLATAPPPPYSEARAAVPISSMGWIALTAFLGGLILNVMPCVLPVLSIKLSSAMKLEGAGRATVRWGFLASAAGVMVFMWGLAAVLFALRQAGVTVGWGLQFQNPVFLALMIGILAVFAANLAGAFEIALPAGLQTRLARAGRAGGHVGDFLTGAFAALLATPCSAPFLGTAIAFALAGRSTDIALVFTFLGLGLAAPYFLVAGRPGLVRHLPRPGRWMIALRVVLGLLLAVTAAWLVWVLQGVAGTTTMLAVVGMTAGLVLLLSLPWLRGAIRAGLALPILGIMLFGAAYLADTSAPRAHSAEVTDWIAFDRAEIARRVSRGEVVFVDVTADWCLTCKANKALVLDRDPVVLTLAADAIILMQADWTRPDPAISRYLESFNRYGIPFNAVYGPAAPDGIVLPELLTPDAVMAALDDAAGDERAIAAQP